MRAESDFKDFIKANQNLKARMEKTANDQYYMYRRNNFIRNCRQELANLKSDFVSGLVLEPQQEKDDIVEKAYRKNPYPAFNQHLGHTYVLTYSKGGEFTIGKYYYRKADAGSKDRSVEI